MVYKWTCVCKTLQTLLKFKTEEEQVKDCIIKWLQYTDGSMEESGNKEAKIYSILYFKIDF